LFVSGAIILDFDDTVQVSEWFPDNYSFEWILFFIFSIFFSFTTLPILLNLNSKFARNTIYSFLSWFLLPTLMAVFFAYRAMTDKFMKDVAIYHFLSICIIHLFVISIIYIKYKKT